jgi:hypothetical protein
VDETKRCPHCQQELPVERFYRQRAQPDGLAPYCKACWSADCRARHARKRAGMVDKRRVQMQSVRHDYFSRIERPIQAYLLGLLASDGNVFLLRSRIKLDVLEGDRELVEITRSELTPASPIYRISHRPSDLARMQCTSPQMCADLANLGVVPRKSKILTWPESLPEALANSFLLGVYDGDGWFTQDKRKQTPYYTVGIMSASVPFIERAAQVISAATGVPLANLSQVNHRAFSIRYGGQRAIAVHDWLHANLPGLARKRIPL